MTYDPMSDLSLKENLILPEAALKPYWNTTEKYDERNTAVQRIQNNKIFSEKNKNKKKTSSWTSIFTYRKCGDLAFQV